MSNDILLDISVKNIGENAIESNIQLTSLLVSLNDLKVSKGLDGPKLTSFIGREYAFGY